MDKKSLNSLPVKHISEVAEEAKQFIRDRKSGKEKSLKTSFGKLNNALMNGIDWNRVITIGGLSGSGKSTFAAQLIEDMITLNEDQPIEVLKFQFEMLGQDELSRTVSSRVNQSIKRIYSAEGTLSDKELAEVERELEKLKNQPIHIVDQAGTVANIVDTIMSFVLSENLSESGKGLVVTIDHSLLTRPEKEEEDKKIIDNLYHTLVMLKKFLPTRGVRAIFIVLSQLNRSIESTERVTNSRLHYPNKNDLFGASSGYHSSDYVIIIHRPCLVNGISQYYGPEQPKWGYPFGLPVYNPDLPDTEELQPMIYLHIIKERFGIPKILMMLDELKYARIVEYVKKAA